MFALWVTSKRSASYARHAAASRQNRLHALTLAFARLATMPLRASQRNLPTLVIIPCSAPIAMNICARGTSSNTGTSAIRACVSTTARPTTRRILNTASGIRATNQGERKLPLFLHLRTGCPQVIVRIRIYLLIFFYLWFIL